MASGDLECGERSLGAASELVKRKLRGERGLGAASGLVKRKLRPSMRRGVALLAFPLMVACGRDESRRAEHAVAAAGTGAGAADVLLSTIAAAEARRAATSVPDAALTHHDARVRRAAARAL